MHELSLALEICRLVEERLAPAERPRLVRVGLAVGNDAGVEADNLAFCLETLLGEPPFGRARPVLERIPGADLQMRFLEVDDDRPDD
jgi:Zn finger protein HypA/HybF involved in hydrogenase expression